MRKEQSPSQPLSAKKESAPSRLFENNREGEVAFEKLYRKHAAGVERFLRSVGAGEDAEDLMQTTFLNVSRVMARNGIPTDIDARAYLYRSARNASIDRAKAKKARVAEVEEEKAKNLGIPSHEQSVLDSIVVRSALKDISPKQREALYLTYFEGSNIPEIAEDHDMPEGTVKSRRHHGIIAMRKELKNMGESGEE